MKALKSIQTIIILIGIIGFSTMINAQPPKGHQPPPLPDSSKIVKLINEMEQTLDLSKDQKAKISNLYFTHFEELKSKRETQHQQREQAETEHDKLRKELDSDVKNILNDAQFNQYKSFIERHKHKKHK